MARTKISGKRKPKKPTNRPTQRQTMRNALIDGIRTYIKAYAKEDYLLYKGLFDARAVLKADESNCAEDDDRSSSSDEMEWIEGTPDKKDSHGSDPSDEPGSAGGAAGGGSGRRAVAAL